MIPETVGLEKQAIEQVVTIVVGRNGRVTLSANGRIEAAKNVDDALEKAKEILNVDPAERDAFNKAVTPDSEDEHAQPGSNASRG